MKIQWTKILVSIVIGVAILDLQLTYLLAFLNNGEIAENLSIALATEILGVTLGYCWKSFKETKASKEIELEHKKLKLDEEETDQESVG